MAKPIKNENWDPSEMSSLSPPTLVIGLGNPILGDDGIGWRVAEKVAMRLYPTTAMPNDPHPRYDVDIDYLSLGGLALMERLLDYERVVIIDAISTGQYPIGSVRQLDLFDLPDQALGHLSSAHDTTLQNALKLGQTMGAKIPNEITIVGIEAQQVYDFSDELSLAVQNSIPEAFDLVMELIK